MTTKHEYGRTVAEFFKHDDAELQALIEKGEARYHSESKGLHFRGLAANIDWSRHKPLEMSLIELQDVLKEGYTIIKANARDLYFSCILRKPDEMIAAELPKVAELAKAEYAESRYQRNVAETARQMEITIARRAREAAAKAAEAAAKVQATEEKKALADLLAAYHKPEVAA
ncbi:hypothetical protein [Pseudomonas sp. R5(2019)]|uniref:hypothetical protein n=1 Tax=Pseudomonas sp. R5(2019) TaxID=2697566 RepID=UPI0014133A24|nr:hypothetical protein [Pseudomonas sp. R5(2019)]NBA94379.1 hypothetical protein [Pseudomonas sp. R5(2019)]